MGVRLLNEVLDHAPADWTQAERLFIAVLAEKARDTTRRAWPGQATIMRRTGLKADSITRLCHRLAAKGWEFREQQGLDRKGKPVFAHRGHAAVYVIPSMCPLGDHDPDRCFPLKGRTVVRPFSEVEAPEKSPWDGADDADCPDGGPALSPESPDDGPANSNESPDGGPAFSEKARTVVRESPDGGPALTVIDPSNFNPQPSAARVPEVPARRTTNPLHIGRQKPLIAKSNVKISDREQIILDWLRENDYPDATHADAKAIDKMTRNMWPGKNIGYLRGVAANSGFDNQYRKVREERAEKVADQIRHLENTRPACAHGTLAGNELHPTHGTMLCPQCRAGIPAKPDQPTTPPPVTAALDAYRRAYDGYLTTHDLISITQQITALHAAGATGQQLVAVATTAAKTGDGILAAAARKDS
ncbi:helix-turn-helix domain-containing protein [Salinispora arenicola]|uniref:helix-turn-helix domain-containing protein n=1 Tax=Salinispora arenicola TaxID=168697 RepID=UPI0028BF0CDF|nr:helix-turn-helix domain-containing protein [Salinispora arenicola]